MKYPFIFFSCLLSLVFLQMDPLSAACGCGKRKHLNNVEQFKSEMFFGGGCGCGGGGGNGTNEIPPDHG